jgi:hypothetical protein
MKTIGYLLIILGLTDLGLWYLMDIDLYGELGIALSDGIWSYSPFIATGAGWLLLRFAK